MIIHNLFKHAVLHSYTVFDRYMMSKDIYTEIESVIFIGNVTLILKEVVRLISP